MRGLLAIALVCACASSKAPAAECDPTTQDCTDIDASVPPIVDAGPDGPPLHGFGEPCTDNDQCESGLCILIGTSGQCTQLCGTCPDDYNCIGVTGIGADGEISFVCVPETNQLCTPCTQDSECTLVGMDKCVTYADGDTYCSQDCSTIGCPIGYACESVDVGGDKFDQCVPTSGACDCTAANPGAMQPCNIVTPFNVCLGAQTCGGASGWGTCDPPSTIDDPDAAFVDSNCDGIDGDMARGIFVSGAGANTATCGLAFNAPCQTIAFGITRAQQAGRPHVYVQSGTYAGPLAMANGISVFGGYDVNWQRDNHTEPGHTVTISGGNPAVTFSGLTAATALDNVVVIGTNATVTGGSAIGILVSGSQAVQLRGVHVDPGNGASGTDGSSGSPGANGLPGSPGNPGCEDSGGFCTGCSRPLGGAGGTSSCGRTGGRGGQPGHGSGGGDAGLQGVGGTPGGAGATCGGNRNCDGTVGQNGTNGADGTNGNGGLSIGTFSGTSYVVANGVNGSAGGHGNGGGGGGGGGGGDTDCDSYGSSGGGGGAGGCGGTGGTRGTGGGGSFGVIAFDSALTIDSSTVIASTGGAGGRGGAGGLFGSGGTGGAGGAYGGGSEQDDGGDGAFGGAGGRGGLGGSGGGGGGGPSVALVCLGTSQTQVSAIATTLTPGTGGAGGPSATAGSDGMAAMTFGCSF